MFRSPVVTIMGHVDHGKTTLLDYLRQSRLTSKEQGGITQHIGAYQVMVGEKKLTFIDTPGHAAFNKMRERGAKVTDLIVLVVAANDGVKPQTIESIRHIQQAGVPFIVAINKIDLPDVNVINVKSQLAEHNVVVTDFGGEVEAVEISAKTGKNIDKLLETITIIADFAQLEADENDELEAVVIEASKQAKQGPMANVIVKNGTLTLRQDIYTSDTYGKVRNIINDLGQNITSLKPGEPGQILGFKEVPAVGAIITAKKPNAQPANQDLAFNLDLSSFDQKPKLKFILKADTQGTLEAINQHLDPDSIDLVFAGVGEVNDSDVELAKTTGAKIIAFQVKVSPKIVQNAKAMDVKIKNYDIIYELIEYIEKKMLKLIEPTIDEIITGEGQIEQIFEMKGLKIAGLKMKSGEIKKSDKLHLKRDDQIIANPVISTMMHAKQEISSLKGTSEGGVVFKQKKLDFKIGDLLIAYTIDD